MDISFIIGIVFGLILIVGVIIYLVLAPRSRQQSSQRSMVSSNLRSLVAAQRSEGRAEGMRKGSSLAVAAAEESQITRSKTVATSRMTLEKKLRYAKLPLTVVQVRFVQFLVTLAIFVPALQYLSVPLWVLALFLSPKIITSIIDRSLSKRFNLFDEDYPVMLMSYVSLLKTGMTAIGGLEAAAKGLDDGSLVRAEVELLIERLRLGLTEEQAIGAFGEDIAHPELELFVQGLILSRRVGGSLSTTLERLARQVRKRQQFRKQAVAAVGMETSSLYMIALIMTLLMLYLGYNSPDLIVPALKHPLGKQIFQFGIALVFFGFYWSKQVTKIKI